MIEITYFNSCIGIIIFFIVISIPLIIFADWRRKKNLENAFGDRQHLDERDFYEKYFQEKDIPFYVVRRVRKILEDILDADFSKLSAEDDFYKNLNFFWQDDSLAEVEMIEAFEEEFEIKFEQADFDRLESFSINDIVELIWRKIRKKNDLSNQKG